MGNKVSFTFLATNAYSRIAKQVSKSTASVRKNFRGLGKEVKKQNTAIGKSTKFLSGKFKALAASAAGFFGAREFLRIGSQFQDSMADLSSITGATGKELQNLRGDVLRLAKSSNIAQDQVALAFTQIASAKSELLKDPKALAVVTEQVLLLANAAGISIPDAMRASVGSLNQFGEGADQAARFVNVMAAGAKVGASLVGETADALRDSGFAAASAGVSFEETNALIQVLAKSELKGARAGVSLRNILTILGSVAGGKFDPKIIGITKSLEAFGEMNLSTAEMTKVFGRESKDAAGFLIQNTALVKQWTRELTGTKTAQEQANVRLSTFSAKMRKMGVVIKDKLIRLFERLEPTITKNMELFTGFIDALKTEDIDKFATSLHGVWEVLKLVGDAVKFIVSLFKGVGTGIGEFIGQIATGNFSADIGTSFTEAFSVGGKLFGLLGQGGGMDAGGLTAGQASRTDINMNIRAPEGAIESVKSTTTGHVNGLNVGQNMVTTQ